MQMENRSSIPCRSKRYFCSPSRYVTPGTDLSLCSMGTVGFMLAVGGGCGAKLSLRMSGTDSASGEEGGQSCCLGKLLDNLWLGCCLPLKRFTKLAACILHLTMLGPVVTLCTARFNIQ